MVPTAVKNCPFYWTISLKISTHRVGFIWFSMIILITFCEYAILHLAECSPLIIMMGIETTWFCSVLIKMLISVLNNMACCNFCKKHRPDSCPKDANKEGNRHTKTEVINDTND